MRPPCECSWSFAIVTMLPSWFHPSSLGFVATENWHLVRQETSPVNIFVDVILVVLVFSYPFLKYGMFLCVIILDTHTIMIRIYHNMTLIYISNDIILYNYLTHDIQNSESLIFFRVQSPRLHKQLHIQQDDVRDFQRLRRSQQRVAKLCRNDAVLVGKVNDFAQRLGFKEKDTRVFP